MKKKVVEYHNIGDLISSIPTSLLLVDNNKTIVKANTEAKKLLGKNIESRSIDDIFKSEEPGIFNEVFKGESIERREVELDNIPIGFSANPVYDEDKKITGAVVILRNLTMIKEMEESLRMNDRLAVLGEMAAGMAHEIRNPLAAIKAGIEYLSKGFNEESKSYNYVQIILKEIKRLDHILSDMTLYALLKPSNKREVDLEKLINNTLVIFEEEMKDRNIEVKKDYSGELNLMADESQMTTVINNLLLNAIDASGDNSKIEIIADEKKGNINLKIKDYGDGIPEEILPKVFIPFFTTKSKGSGLGLSIVNRIIQNHYGVIKAYNWENGACFSIKIPKGF